MTRQTKTPRQRAEEAYAIADRRYNRAIKTRDRLEKELTAVEAELAEAQALRAYAKQHPALQRNTQQTAAGGQPTSKEGTTA